MFSPAFAPIANISSKASPCVQYSRNILTSLLTISDTSQVLGSVSLNTSWMVNMRRKGRRNNFGRLLKLCFLERVFYLDKILMPDLRVQLSREGCTLCSAQGGSTAVLTSTVCRTWQISEDQYSGQAAAHQ